MSNCSDFSFSKEHDRQNPKICCSSDASVQYEISKLLVNAPEEVLACKTNLYSSYLSLHRNNFDKYGIFRFLVDYYHKRELVVSILLSLAGL